MIRAGSFFDADTVTTYKVFEMKESRFYRIDICSSTASVPFLDTNDVLFSMYKKRTEYMYGDYSLYKKYKDCQMSALELRDEMKTKPSKIGGQFISEQYKQIDDMNYYKNKLQDGMLREEVFAFKGSWIFLELIHTQLLKEIMPVNQSQYTSNTLKEAANETGEYIPLETLRRMYDIDHIADKDYKVERDRTEIRALVDYLKENKKTVRLGFGYDTETSGLDFHLYSEETLTGFIFSKRKGHSRYLPTGHLKFDNIPIEMFKEIMEELYEAGVELAAHGKKFEEKILLKYKVNAHVKHCSLILSTLIDPIMIKGRHGLKYLTEEATGKQYLELNQIFSGPINFPVLDEELTKWYACPDADNGGQIIEERYDYMLKHFPNLRTLYEMECELAELKAEQEFYGIRVDPGFVVMGAERSLKNSQKFEQLAHKMIGGDLDLNSPKDLSNYLYNVLKCNVDVRTKKGFPSCGALALKKIADLKRETPVDICKEDLCDIKGKPVLKKESINKAQYPVVQIIQKYRDYKKQQTGFYDRINTNKNRDRFFFWINQNGTSTGRQSSTMHQMSKECRPAFMADSEHHDFVAADFAQMELRMFFMLAGETELVLLTQDPDVDIHRAIAAIIQNKEVWDISAEERQKDKNRNFGVIYLISGRGLSVQKYGAGASNEKIKECDDSIDTFWNKFKRCDRFVKNNAKQVLEKHYIDTIFGRIRRFDELSNPNLDNTSIASIVRMANNMPVQGSCADVTKTAELKIHKYIKKMGWDKLVDTPQGKFPLVRCMLSVHDEVLISRHFSVPVEEIMKMIYICMELRVELKDRPTSPLFVGIKFGETWGDGKRDDLDLPRDLAFEMIEKYEKTGVSAVPEGPARDLLLDIINHHRDKELRIYMEKLLEEVGSLEVEDIWNKLRHPKFTHELIARFPQSEEHESKHGKLSHHDRMRYAITEYLKFRLLDEETLAMQTAKKHEEDRKFEESKATLGEDFEVFDDKDIILDLQAMAGITEAYYDADTGRGDSDEIDADDYVDAEQYFLFAEDIKHINDRVLERPVDLIKFYDEILLTVDKYTTEQTNQLIAALWENRCEKGFYSVVLIKNDRIINTNFRVDELKNEEKIYKMLEDFQQENLKALRV